MTANDNEQNDHDGTEGLVDLNRVTLQELPINREEEVQQMLINGPFDKSILSRHFSSLKEAYQALLLESFYTTKRKGIYQLISGKNVCRIECMGDRDRIIWNSQQKRFVNEQ